MAEPEFVMLEELVSRVWEWSVFRAFGALNHNSPVPAHNADRPRANLVMMAVNWAGTAGCSWADPAGSYASIQQVVDGRNRNPNHTKALASGWEFDGRSSWSVVRIDRPDLFAAWVAEARRAQTFWVMSGANGGGAFIVAIMSKVVDPEVSAAARRLNALARKGTPAQKAAWRENMKGGGRPRIIEGVWMTEMRRIADRLRACTTPKDYYDWLKGLPEPHPQAKPDVNLTASWRAQRAARWRARQLVNAWVWSHPPGVDHIGRQVLAEAIESEPCPDWRKPRATVTR